MGALEPEPFLVKKKLVKKKTVASRILPYKKYTHAAKLPRKFFGAHEGPEKLCRNRLE